MPHVFLGLRGVPGIGRSGILLLELRLALALELAVTPAAATESLSTPRLCPARLARAQVVERQTTSAVMVSLVIGGGAAVRLALTAHPLATAWLKTTVIVAAVAALCVTSV
jgi:hypothetical protein